MAGSLIQQLQDLISPPNKPTSASTSTFPGFGGGSSGGGGANFGDSSGFGGSSGGGGASGSFDNGGAPATAPSLPASFFTTLKAPVQTTSPTKLDPSNARKSTLNIPKTVQSAPVITMAGVPINDKRVRISMFDGSPGIYYRDPDNYLLTPLAATAGVLFPYQPKVDISFGASYQAQKVVQSNFTFYSFENSEMKPFDLSCDFPVRNQFEGQYVIAAIIFLRSLTMMFTGNDNANGLMLAGAPPLVVSLSGMGFGGLDNIPVAITNVTTSYPDNVDYMSIGIPALLNEVIKLPSVLTINVSCQPMFSRAFASAFSALKYSSGQQRLLGLSAAASLAKLQANAVNQVQNTNTDVTDNDSIPTITQPTFTFPNFA